MIAIDANAVVALLVDDAELGSASRSLYAEHDLVAPDLLPYEVTSVLRKLVHGSASSPSEQRERLFATLASYDSRPCRTATSLSGCGALRDNLSTYDAAYVAVAELFDVPLLTFDDRIRRSPGPTCQFVDV